MMQSKFGSRLAGAHTGVKHEQICAVLNSKPPAQLQLWAALPSSASNSRAAAAQRIPDRQGSHSSLALKQLLGLSDTQGFLNCAILAMNDQLLVSVLTVQTECFLQLHLRWDGTGVTWQRKQHTGTFTAEEFQLVKNVPAAGIAFLSITWY